MTSTEVQAVILQRQSRSHTRVVFVWLLIFTLVGLVAYNNARSVRLQEFQQLLLAEQARMFGMLALQMKSLQSSQSGSMAHDRIDAGIKQLDKASRTPEDRLRLAILVGENSGPEAALKRLMELDQSNSSPEIASDVLAMRSLYQHGADALEPALRERLIRRYEYLGRLALAYGVPADREPRKALVAEALVFTVRIVVIGLVSMTMLMVSFVLFVAGCVWFYKGNIHRAPLPDTYDLRVFLEAFALYLVLFQILGRVMRHTGAVSIQWTWLTLMILPVALKWASLRTSGPAVLKAIGWYRGRGFAREFGVGIAGYFAGLPIVAIGCFITFILIRYTGVQAASPIIQELSGSPLSLVGLYGLACIFAPVMEETMFRGFLFCHLRQRQSWIVSAAVVSLIFALLHPQGWVAAPTLGAIALVLAALREWRGSLIAPIAAHACNNFLALTFGLLLLR